MAVKLLKLFQGFHPTLESLPSTTSKDTKEICESHSIMSGFFVLQRSSSEM
jgi:hypothetical protein